MISGISIVHIEDEFADFRSLPQTVMKILSDYFDEIGDAKFVNVYPLGTRNDQASRWEAYEISWGEQIVVRYILVQDKCLPDEVRGYLLEKTLFVLDVLRPNHKAMLEPSIAATVNSIRGNVSDWGDTMLFTAYQGEELGHLQQPLISLVELCGKGLGA